MPRAAAPHRLRSARFLCFCRFPSTVFSRRVEGKLYDGPSSLPRTGGAGLAPLLMDFQQRVPSAPCGREGAEGTTKTQANQRSGVRRAAVARGMTRASTPTLQLRGCFPARGVTRDPRSRTTRSGWEKLTCSRGNAHYPRRIRVGGFRIVPVSPVRGRSATNADSGRPYSGGKAPRIEITAPATFLVSYSSYWRTVNQGSSRIECSHYRGARISCGTTSNDRTIETREPQLGAAIFIFAARNSNE